MPDTSPDPAAGCLAILVSLFFAVFIWSAIIALID